MNTTTHWTKTSLENFKYRIISDFLMQLERKMETEDLSRKGLAQRLSLSAGRVSQILNGATDNFEILSVIKYAKALDMNVSIVAYENSDPDGTHGPIDSEIFTKCWERQGKPVDFFDLEKRNENHSEIQPDFADYFQEGSTSVVYVNFGSTARKVMPESLQTAA